MARYRLKSSTWQHIIFKNPHYTWIMARLVRTEKRDSWSHTWNWPSNQMHANTSSRRDSGSARLWRLVAIESNDATSSSFARFLVVFVVDKVIASNSVILCNEDSESNVLYDLNEFITLQFKIPKKCTENHNYKNIRNVQV